MIRLFFSGDLFIEKCEVNQIVAQSLKEIIKTCDVACCNLEGPISDKSMMPLSKIGPNLSQDVRVVEAIKNAGFNLVCMANNHIMDYGISGVERTCKTLSEMDISHVGVGSDFNEAIKAYVIRKEGVRVAIVSVAEGGFGAAFNEGQAGYAWFGHPCFIKHLKSYCDEYDKVVVMCHGGAERWEVPLPEYRDLYRSWIEIGVSAVIAHHPHVPQGYERYNDGFIFFSLGNFAFNYNGMTMFPKSFCVVLQFNQARNIETEIYPTLFQNGVVNSLGKDEDKMISHLNKMLDDPTYLKIVKEKCLSCYKELYRDYYKHVLNIYSGGFRNLLKTIYYRFLKEEYFSDFWLYHNLMIESHYWICRRALNDS